MPGALGGFGVPARAGVRASVHALSEYGKDRLNDHPLAPRSPRTLFQIVRIARFGMKTLIAEADHLPLEASDHGM